MERLLRDGGDLDSMDRSLLDYSAVVSNKVNSGSGGNMHNGGSDGAGTPTPEVATSPTAAASKPVVVNKSAAKRDMVVRFTDNKSNNVMSALATSETTTDSSSKVNHQSDQQQQLPPPPPLSPNDNPVYGGSPLHQRSPEAANKGKYTRELSSLGYDWCCLSRVIIHSSRCVCVLHTLRLEEQRADTYSAYVEKVVT